MIFRKYNHQLPIRNILDIIINDDVYIDLTYIMIQWYLHINLLIYEVM